MNPCVANISPHRRGEMFELTAAAITMTAVFAFIDYLFYFVFRLTIGQRFVLGLAMFGGFLWLMKTEGERVFLPLARAVKADLADETRTESMIDFAGFFVVLFLSYILHWMMYARATGKSDTYGLLTGALVGAVVLA
jgi:hypothetical protein